MSYSESEAAMTISEVQKPVVGDIDAAKELIDKKAGSLYFLEPGALHVGPAYTRVLEFLRAASYVEMEETLEDGTTIPADPDIDDELYIEMLEYMMYSVLNDLNTSIQYMVAEKSHMLDIAPWPGRQTISNGQLVKLFATYFFEKQTGPVPTTQFTSEAEIDAMIALYETASPAMQRYIENRLEWACAKQYSPLPIGE